MIPLRPRLTDPSAPAEWLSVANLRLQEARRLCCDGLGCVAAAYLAGYAIECSLKAYLLDRGTPKPGAGGEGHNLRALWAACDMVLRDIQDSDGSKNYFMTAWSTDLRYQCNKNTTIADEKLIVGAGQVLGRLTTLMRRRQRRKR